MLRNVFLRSFVCLHHKSRHWASFFSSHSFLQRQHTIHCKHFFSKITCFRNHTSKTKSFNWEKQVFAQIPCNLKSIKCTPLNLDAKNCKALTSPLLMLDPQTHRSRYLWPQCPSANSEAHSELSLPRFSDPLYTDRSTETQRDKDWSNGWLGWGVTLTNLKCFVLVF